MANSIYLGGGIKSAYCGGNVKEIHLGTNKLFPEEESGLVIDGLTYRTAVMPDGREWMCENLQVNLNGAAFYNNDETTYGRDGKNYGRLYPKSILPELNTLVKGWKVPSVDEYSNLITSIGGTAQAFVKLKASYDWGAKGTDDFGFSVLPAGWYFTGGSRFVNVGSQTGLFTITKHSSGDYYALGFNLNGTSGLAFNAISNPKLSVRLVKDV